MNLSKILEAFNSHKGIGFISFPYKKVNGEMSRRLINIGISYENAKKRDLQTLNSGVKYIAGSYDIYDWDKAIFKLKTWLKEEKINRKFSSLSTGAVRTYIKLTANGALKYNTTTEELYVIGSLVRKTVDVKGKIKEVISSPETLAINTIRKHYLSTGNYRAFKLSGIVGSVKINGNILYID